MKKILSLFARNFDRSRAIDEVTPGAEWVIAGEGVATRKWDGTCCLVRCGRLYKRYQVRDGKKIPEDFEPSEIDKNTGKHQGWIPVGTGPEDARHREAFLGTEADGTYELCGPKVQGNPEGCDRHVLIPHGKAVVDAPRTFAGLKTWLATAGIEGIVWHHPDGRLVKIKARDFGISR